MIMHKGIDGETYNIGCHEETTNLELSQKLVKLIHPDTQDVDKLIEHVADRPFNDVRYYLNYDKLLQLGWKPEFSFDEGLAKTIEWYKSVRAAPVRTRAHPCAPVRTRARLASRAPY